MAEGLRRTSVIAVAAALGLAGCANVPTSGELEVGSQGQLDQVPEGLPHVEISAPRPGASAEEIVNSFIEVMVTYEEGSAAVRQYYLTEDAAAEWDPSVIQISRYRVGTTDDGLTLKYTLTGKIVDGTYIAVPPKEKEHPLKLAEVDGELRITNPPEGMIMAEADFERDFRMYNRYFWDPSFSFLVPDPVYLTISNPSKIQTQLANALLDGPSEALKPGVRTAFPPGTELIANTAPVVESTAEVDLSGEAGQATSEQRKQMAAQLTWTLTEVASVVDVLPTAAGSLLYTEEPVTRTDFKSFGAAEMTRSPDTPLYGATDTGMSRLNSEGILAAVPGPLGSTPGLTEVAVNPRAQQAVAVDSTGTQLLLSNLEPDADVHTIFEGSSLSSLAWDPTGLIWAIDRDDGRSSVVALTSEGDSVSVDIPGRDGRRVDALAVSSDGTRLAIVLDGEAEIRTIVRADGASGAVEVINSRVIDSSVLDVAWYDGTSLALLKNPAGQSPLPVQAGLTREAREFEPVDGAISIAAAAGQTSGGIVVGSEDGSLYALAPGGSAEPVPAMRAPTYPG